MGEKSDIKKKIEFQNLKTVENRRFSDRAPVCVRKPPVSDRKPAVSDTFSDPTLQPYMPTPEP